jgi:DNA-directed RNA polymerase subunit RPC12/RpoP
MRSKRDSKREGPAVIVCERCGHHASTALGASDLHGKVLRCTACGHRQTFIDAAMMEAERKTIVEEIARAYAQAPPPQARH